MPPIVFAADLGGTKLSAALIDSRGKILAAKSEPVDLSSTHAPVGQICRMATSLAASRQGAKKFSAVGVAIPGLVRRTGTVWAPNLPGWENVPLVRLLKRRLKVPVVVESDRNAAVLGESWRGAGRGKSDVIALIVGTGIGAGILSGGKVLRGAHELSGCAGWMVVTEEDKEEFRRVGSLESLAAGQGVARAAREAVEAGARGLLAALPLDTITADKVAAAARSGDGLARQLFERVGRFLGLAVANLISLFDPEVVVLGGGLAGAADLYFNTLERVARERCQPLAARQVRIEVSRLGGDGNLLGMARLAWEASSRKKARR